MIHRWVKMEWISIYDKSNKPKINEICVAWMAALKEPVCVRYTEDEHGPLWIELVDIDIFDNSRKDLISHWMPLPEPPED